MVVGQFEDLNARWKSGARAMDVLFPYALWTLVSLIVIGSGIALLVW
jgi:hypothetical protein